MKLRNYMKAYLDYCEFLKGLDQKTLKAYRTDIQQFFDYIQSPRPGKAEIEEYLTYLHKQFRPKTVKRKIASVKAFYSYLEERRLLAENPFRNFRIKFREALVLPRIIPRDEIETLLNFMYRCLNENSCPSRGHLLRDIAVIEAFFSTGARVCEISGLPADSVNLNTGLILLKGKRQKERYVQITSDSALKSLRLYYAENRDAIRESGFFFVNSRNGRYSEQSIRQMLKKYCRMAGIERNIKPHMFRHSVATYLIEGGVDISCVQQILGHSSIKTTQIYIHVASAVRAEMLKKTHPRNNMNIIGAA